MADSFGYGPGPVYPVLRPLAAGVVCAALAAGCAPPPVPIEPPAASAAAAASCAGGWTCEQQQRFDAVRAYSSKVVGPRGALSVVFTDRLTGQSWRTGPTAQPGWTASTVKLAIAADLLAERGAGRIVLAEQDQHDMDAMLNSSDEAATDRLWRKFGGEPMLARFRDRFGMPGLHFVPGFSRSAYWGFVKCTVDDLAALTAYVLDRTAPADRAYLVAALRGVAPNQRWGVWAAGPAQQPGNKNGWSDEVDPYGKHWVANSVGFAGEGERYAVAVMYQLDPAATLDDGAHTVSDVVALLFGRPVPAPITLPIPDG
ncbi:hypothetical protein [Pseudonocardia spinosispora]|uniref:hypothetical protein n=1 Tax=Pseudonocardia spinosispora TaxID=103441 RepID=UPI0012EB56D0|nr:hypothetical protein [Pseudonocardia spinosispora]